METVKHWLENYRFTEQSHEVSLNFFSMVMMVLKSSEQKCGHEMGRRITLR